MTDNNNNNRTIIFGVHGWWGSGKTWLVHTLPGPRLVMDMEGGSEDVQCHTVSWNPLDSPCPGASDLTEDTSVVVDISDYTVVTHLLQILETGIHPFNSVVFDSLTENQKQLKEAVANPGQAYDPNATFEQQAWGRLLNNGELVIRRLRNLTRKNSKRRVNVGIVMASDTEQVPAVPLLQGALRKSIAGFLDLQGYLYTAMNNETQELARIMQISPSPMAQAKCRLHNVHVHYGDHIVNPDMRDILAVINGGSTAETSYK